MKEKGPLRICVVGAGTRFLGGISYHTLRLANVLAQSHDVSAILMRQLLPTRFYPGRQRVGANLTRLENDPRGRGSAGLHCNSLPTILPPLIFPMQDRPQLLVLQCPTRP